MIQDSFEKHPLSENHSLPIKEFLYTNDSFPCLVDKGEQIESYAKAKNEQERLHITARNALRYLTYGTPLHESNLATWKNFKALFLKRDQGLLDAIREEMNKMFHRAFDLLHENKLNSEAEIRLTIFIKNILAAVPYLNPSQNEVLYLPVKNNKQWCYCKYHVEKIDISPQTGLLSKLIEEQDRLYAYGLVSHEKYAPPFLILMGSHYPSGQGALINWLYNFYPFKSVGEKHDLTNIKDWVVSHPGCIVTGHSKGGTMAIMLAVHFNHLISESNALNPAPLTRGTVHDLNDEILDFIKAPQCKINIYIQLNDPVFLLGHELLSGSKIYSIGTKNKTTLIESHASYFAGWKSTTIVDFDLEQLQHTLSVREYVTYVKEYLNAVIFPVLYGYLLSEITARKLVRVFEENKTLITQTSSVTASAICFGIVASGMIAPLTIPVVAAFGPFWGYTVIAAACTGACHITSRILPEAMIGAARLLSYGGLTATLIIGGLSATITGSAAYLGKTLLNQIFTKRVGRSTKEQNHNKPFTRPLDSTSYIQRFINRFRHQEPNIIDATQKSTLMTSGKKVDDVIIDIINPDLFKKEEVVVDNKKHHRP